MLPEGFKDDLLRAHELRNPVEPAPPPSTFVLPDGFLEGPAPLDPAEINDDNNKINFKADGLPEYASDWAFIIDNVLTQEECDTLVAAAEATTNGKWERAMINIGGGMQAMYEDTRKCGRIIWDSKEIMDKLWARIGPLVPRIHFLEDWVNVTGNGPAKRREVWKVTGLNERGRYLKYTGGEYFKRMYWMARYQCDY
jgi:hypothetical protein